MTKQVIATGITANDGTGDSLREGANKINANFTEIYSSLGNGSSLLLNLGTPASGQVLQWNGASFVPATITGANNFSSILADSGSVIAGSSADTITIRGGTNVDTSIVGNVLTINAVGGSSGGGGASVSVGDTPPVAPADGDLWYDSEQGVLAVWYSDQGYWVQTNGSATVGGDINITNTGGSSATTFLELTDTPSAFVADYYVKVNAAGDGLEFVENGGGSGLAASAFTNVNLSDPTYTANVFDYIFADTTTGSITVALPATPTQGDEVRFLDIAGTFSTNNLQITSALNIQGDSANFIVDIDYAGFSLIYVNDSVGWLLKDR